MTRDTLDISDLPPVDAIMRVRTEGGDRLAIWRSGRLIAPTNPVSLAELLGHPLDAVREWFETAEGSSLEPSAATALAPVDDQEVWGAGVTYRRSRDARAAESGNAALYDHVYEAERPEIFYKAAGRTVVAPGAHVGIRSDSVWSVPEPELAVLANSAGVPIAYSIGNDMTSRSIEGENPLYLPQAKIYDRSCAIGPAAVPTWAADPGTISIKIMREGEEMFSSRVHPSAMVRDVGELVCSVVSWVSCPGGLWLLTGTGIVPPDDFTLQAGDEIAVAIEGLGVLRNGVTVTGPEEG
jgi:2-dehydro-3-deoxy-D-arabinonate dehydratase